MDRRSFLLTFLASALAAPLGIEAQPTGKVYRIGVLLTGENQHLVKALEQGLRDLGYVDGRNIVIVRRSAEGRQERLPALAAELVRLKPDVIVTGSNVVIAAVKEATTTIPVVMAVSRDPVGARFIGSLARPGGNITGMANDATPETIGKNLEFLKAAVPRASRVAFVWNSAPPGALTFKNALEKAGRDMHMTVQPVEVRSRDELERAFATMVREGAQGMVVAQDPITLGARHEVVRLAAKSRLPAVYALREFVEAGGLISYGPNIRDQFRRVAVYVDKILGGVRAADLPVEQATTFELVINLKTARALGLTIPPSLLARADQVIE